MRRVLDLKQSLMSFEGEPIKRGGEGKDKDQPFTLKSGLLIYIRNSIQMNLDPSEQETAYILGYLIGPAEGKVDLTTAQWDVLKKLADFGKIRNQANEEQPIYGLEIKQQLKELVDKAPIIEEKPKTDKEKEPEKK